VSPADPSASDTDASRLRSELARSERLRRAYEDIILTIDSSVSLQELLEKIVGIVSVAVESTGAYLYVWDDETERLVFRATTEAAHRHFVNAIQLRLGEGLVGWVAYEREPVILEDEAMKDPRFKPFDELQEERFKSALVVPILLNKLERVGVIALWSRRRAHFGAEHLEILSEVAALLAGVIDRARLNDQARRRARALTFLGDLWAKFSMPLPMDQLMGGVAEATIGVLESDVCIIALINEEGRFVLKGVAPARDDLFAEAVRALGSDVPVVPSPRTGGSHDDDPFRPLAMLLADRFEEAASAPLLAGSNHLGFISCYRHHPFSSDERDLLSLIAGQLAFGIPTLEAKAAPETDPVGQLLRNLASGKSDAAAAVSVAAALGVDLTQPHVLVQARVLPKDQTEASATVAEQSKAASDSLVRGASAVSASSVFQQFPGGVLGLMRVTTAQDAAALQRELQALSDEVAKRHSVAVSIGLSSVQDSAAGYPDAYREAAETLEIGTKVRGEGHVIRFDELGPYVYLFRMAGDPRVSRDPWMKSLLPLIEYDKKKHSELLETLDTYLECRGNTTLTAERLYLHRNTLRQRLSRIETLIKINLSQTEDWLPLHFAVKLARLRKTP
jgi:DNA-binding PucR family transcriptional regulator